MSKIQIYLKKKANKAQKKNRLPSFKIFSWLSCVKVLWVIKHFFYGKGFVKNAKTDKFFLIIPNREFSQAHGILLSGLESNGLLRYFKVCINWPIGWERPVVSCLTISSQILFQVADLKISDVGSIPFYKVWAYSVLYPQVLKVALFTRATDHQ